jgi:GntR family transcriptional regulator / MocR family aminotransferase
VLRRWELTMTLDRSSPLSVHLQITQAVIDEIQRGRLPPGTPLPGTRTLAQQLGVNRKTAVLAYDELLAQGWIDLQAKRGAFVSPQLPAARPRSDGARTAEHFPLQDGIAAATPCDGADDGDSAGIISFSDGVPDTRLIPFDVLSRAYRHALVTSARANRLAYGDPRGSATLRGEIAAMLRLERGLNTNKENVCAVRGSQMGIYLAARLLVRPGDHVVLEHLSYPPARAAFASCGATLHGVSQDACGLITDELEALCRGRRIRAVFVTPHHQFPTTVTMSAERRMRLIDLARRHDFAIVEDDYDHEFHFAHHPMLPLASMDHGGRVIHIGSLSKVLAPGLRLGYVAASADVIRRCAAEIMLIDRQGNALTELAVTELMHSGELRRHIRRALRVYQARLQDATTQVRAALHPHVVFDVPGGGLALWLRLADGLDIAALTRDALAEGVRILPGSQFSDRDTPVPAFRLGYGSLDEGELAHGVTRLKAAFSRQTGGR